MPIEITCKICGKKFKVKPCDIKRRKTCSLKCQYMRLSYLHKKQRIKKICLICGKEFYVKPSHSHRKTCSYECRKKYLSIKYRGRKGKKLSEEAKRKISENMKKLWQNSEYREKQLKARIGRKLSEETKRKLSERFKGSNNPMYGKKRPDLIKINKDINIRRLKAQKLKGRKRPLNVRKKISESKKGKKLTQEHKQKIREGMKKAWKRLKSDYQKFMEWRKKVSESKKGDKNPMKNPEVVKKMLMNRNYKIPNKMEEKLINIIEKHKLPFEYTGNGKIAIGKRNPDFINNNGKKLIIELFGEYWHNPLLNKIPYSRTYRETIKYYKKYGYKCLIIWDSELSNEKLIVKRIKSFLQL